MKQRASTTLTITALVLAGVVLGLSVLTERLAAETGYLPLVLHNGGSTIPGAPTQTATSTATATASPTVGGEYPTPFDTATSTATATSTPLSATATATASPTASPTATSQPTGTNTPTPSPTQPPTHTPTATGTTIPAPGDTITITVGDNFFNPVSVTINVGDTVVWRRVSGFHNVRADDGSFTLGEDAAGNPGSTWTTVSHTFTVPGTVGYHCQVHGIPGIGMFGTVEVLPVSASRLAEPLAGPGASHAVRATHLYSNPTTGTAHPPQPASSH